MIIFPDERRGSLIKNACLTRGIIGGNGRRNK
jgi:hypothetical protein